MVGMSSLTTVENLTALNCRDYISRVRGFFGSTTIIFTVTQIFFHFELFQFIEHFGIRDTDENKHF